jgi:hypothetical protein
VLDYNDTLTMRRAKRPSMPSHRLLYDRCARHPAARASVHEAGMRGPFVALALTILWERQWIGAALRRFSWVTTCAPV